MIDTLGTHTQWDPAVAFDGENFLVVWRDNRTGLRDIYGARVDRNGTVLDTAGIPICTDTLILYWPALAFDGTNYLVVWEAGNAGPSSNLHGAKAKPDGTVGAEFPVVVADYTLQHSALAHGGGVTFVVYIGWTYIVNGKYYGNDRIWGKFGPFPGVEEAESDETRAAKVASVVRGTMFMPDFPARRATFALYNSTGRKVLDLKPGPNDVRQLASGIYFVKQEDRRGSVRVVLVE